MQEILKELKYFWWAILCCILLINKGTDRIWWSLSLWLFWRLRYFTSFGVKIVLVSSREDKTVDKWPPCAKKLWDKTIFSKWELLTDIPAGLVQHYASHVFGGDQIFVIVHEVYKCSKRPVVRCLSLKSCFVMSPRSIFRSEQYNNFVQDLQKWWSVLQTAVEFFPLNLRCLWKQTTWGPLSSVQSRRHFESRTHIAFISTALRGITFGAV